MNNKTIILAVEDISKVSTGIKERITNEFNINENSVFCFNYADDALDFLEKNSPKIIIVDLAMASDGLPKEDRNATKNSRLTGWVILKNYVFNGEFKNKLKNTHCYIFSGYGKIFCKEIGITMTNDTIDINEINKKLKEIRANLYFVPKKGVDGGASELVNMIKLHSQELLN